MNVGALLELLGARHAVRMVGATARAEGLFKAVPPLKGAGQCNSLLGAASHKAQSYTEAPSFLITTFIPLSS